VADKGIERCGEDGVAMQINQQAIFVHSEIRIFSRARMKFNGIRLSLILKLFMAR
jgi:hypothetical protein